MQRQLNRRTVPSERASHGSLHFEDEREGRGKGKRVRERDGRMELGN